jgi:outer membrane protein OmpA-like peptidoglycan-associated protein
MPPHAMPRAAAPTARLPQIVGEVLRSGGAPLESGPRSLMESAFGHDFSRVRIHTDQRASVSDSECPAVPAVLQRCGAVPCAPGGCGHDDEPELQRQTAGPAPGPAPVRVPATVHEVVRSPGRELPLAVRQLMEPRFGHDFGDVRVHTDAAAARTAGAVGARAYTLGHHVVFGDGQFVPDRAVGQRLIAHELAHVIQQRAGGGRLAAQPLTVSDPSDPAEREADRAAGEVLGPVASGGPGPAGPGPVGTAAGTQAPQAVPAPACQTVPDGGAPPGLTLSGFGQGSPVLPGSGYPPLQALARRLKAGGVGGELQVHGFASKEGDPGFNTRLSCGRAYGVKAVCQANGIRNPISLFAHGATEALGPGPGDNRAVVVTEPAPPAKEPGKQSEPPPPQQAQQAEPPVSCDTPGCPPEYCKPFGTQQEAEQDRAANAEGILTLLPNSRARPLFREFIFGGGPLRDISGEFAADFTNSVDTIATTRRLIQALEDAVKSNPPRFAPGSDTVTVELTDVLNDSDLKQILATMVFTNVFEVPGLIAGGVGTNQSACPVGAQPSSQNDARLAQGKVTISKNPDGSLAIQPSITYTVIDTLDFCPGNCGGRLAQILTVPLSRWEASFISGDVPFTVRFPAPVLTGAFDDADVE